MALRQRSLARRWINISRLPKARKRALWERIQTEAPELAHLITDDPDLSRLRAAFEQPDILIQQFEEPGC